MAMPDKATRDRIMQAASFWPSRVITTGVKLRIFTLLSGRRMTAAALAREADLDARPLEVLMDALVAMELLEKEGDEYANRPAAAEVLVEGKPGTMVYRLLQEHESWPFWEGIEEVIRSGRPARSAPLFESDEAGTERLLRSLHEHARLSVPVVVEKVGARGRLLDLGGGSGSYSVAMCEAEPSLHATIFDLPGAIRVAREFVGRSPAADRIELITGDYRTDPLGGPYDVAFISNIIHSVGPETIVRLLRKIREALLPGGRVVVRDLFLGDDRTSPAFAALFAVNMVVHTEAGRCYSETEACRFLEEAGFAEITTLEPGSLIEARNPKGTDKAGS